MTRAQTSRAMLRTLALTTALIGTGCATLGHGEGHRLHKHDMHFHDHHQTHEEYALSLREGAAGGWQPAIGGVGSD